jgi:DNA-binding GntR family transcriptional regulator
LSTVYGKPLTVPVGQSQHSTKLARSLHSGRVANLLREAIVDGTLAAGTPLVEARVAEELAVSRGPVRNALHVLEGEGLVETRPNGRMVVSGFRHEDVDDLLRVRFELEALAIRWGIERDASLERVLHAFREIEAEGTSSRRLVELDVTFHRAVVELGDSRFLLSSWLALAPVIEAVITIGNRRLETKDPESNYARIVDSHRRLVAALETRDAEAAVASLGEQFGFTGSMFAEAS